MFLDKQKNKNRNRAYNRFQRDRSIKNKKYILQHIMSYDKRLFTPNRMGKLNKGKVHCSCKMCRYEQHYGFDKLKYKDKQKWMTQEIKSFENHRE
jgi:hypothetical protein